MKQWGKTVGAVLVASTLIFGGVSLSGGLKAPQTAYAADESLKNTVSVAGKGELSIKPDVVYLSIGVTSSADTAEAAQKATSEKITKISALLKGSTWAIADKDIQTAQFYVQPNYAYTEQNGQQVKGYNAQHTLKVTYRDLTKVGGLLDAVSAAGANNIGNLQFGVEEPSAFEEQVIQKAMDNAKLKAAAIAKAAGRSLGQVVTVVQNDTGSDPVLYMEASISRAAADTAGGTTVEAGEVKVSTQLSVVFELK